MERVSELKKYANTHNAENEEHPVDFSIEINSGYSALILKLLPMNVITKDYACDEPFAYSDSFIKDDSLDTQAYKLVWANECNYDFEDVLSSSKSVLNISNKEYRAFAKNLVKEDYEDMLISQ